MGKALAVISSGLVLIFGTSRMRAAELLKLEQCAQALSEYELMLHLHQELMDDPFMSDRKWILRLPEFEYLDRTCAQHNCTGILLPSLTQLVLIGID